MKKTTIALILVLFLFGFAAQAHAAGFVKPSSRLYFLQSWGESVRMFFTFSREAKINYLIALSDRRVEEMQTAPTAAVAGRYQKHFESLDDLATQVKDQEGAAEKIREASLRQQEVLAKVYDHVPDEAKDAILNAQENSSKNVAAVVGDVLGADQEQKYSEKVGQIQQAEKEERMERLERVEMESNPNANPENNSPRELRGGNELKSGLELNPGGDDGNHDQPVQPLPMNAPTGQNN